MRLPPAAARYPLLTSEQTRGIDPARTVLLFFDMLNAYVKEEGGATRPRYRSVVANAVRLLEAARRADLTVVYVYGNHRPDGRTNAQLVTDTDVRLKPWPATGQYLFAPGAVGGTWGAQVIDDLAPRPEDYLIPKFRWNSFHQSYLDLALRTLGVDTIIISGGSTDSGVASTAYAARDLDYNLILVRDACIAAEDDVHDFFMDRLFPRMGRVRSADETVELIREASSG